MLVSSFFYFGEFFLSQNSQIKQSVIAHYFDPTEGLRHTEVTERYCQRWLYGSVKSVDLMSLWAFVCSVLLCFSVRERRVLCERKKGSP